MKTVYIVVLLWAVLCACSPPGSKASNSPRLAKVDYRDLFEGTWCWENTVACGTSRSVSKTSLVIAKSNVPNEVTLMGLTGVVEGGTIIISTKADSFGGIWSGHIDRNGASLLVKLSIYYSETGITCTNTGSAELKGECLN